MIGLLNLTIQPQIDQLNNRVSALENTVNNIEQQLTGINVTLNEVGTTLATHSIAINNLINRVNQINNQITSLTNTVNQLNTTVNSMSTNIDDLIDQYKPIMGFTYFNVTFTDFQGNTATGSFTGAWYRPIKLLPSDISNAGVDLKYVLLVLREINISPIPNNGNFFFSDPKSLPIPFVNNNDFRVFWDSGSTDGEMKTRQADYDVINIPINNWSLAVKEATNQNVVNDSACFIVMYI